MPILPLDIPRLWLRGLLAVAPLGLGAYLLYKAFDRRTRAVEQPPPAPPVPEPAGVEVDVTAAAPREADAPTRPAPGPDAPIIPPDHRLPWKGNLVRRGRGRRGDMGGDVRTRVRPWRLGLTPETGLLAAGLALV